jgi:hypothetical protein
MWEFSLALREYALQDAILNGEYKVPPVRLEWSTELQAIERKLLAEIEDLEKTVLPRPCTNIYTYYRKEDSIIKRSTDMMEAIPNITTGELAQLLDKNCKNKRKH